MSDFDDLVQQGLDARRAAERTGQREEMELSHFRSIFDKTLARTGAGAAQSLVQNRVPSEPVGYIHDPLIGRPKAVQTGEHWRFPTQLHLLRDGTWWSLHGMKSSRMPKSSRERGPAYPTINGPYHQLTSDILKTGQTGEPLPRGEFSTSTGYSDDYSLIFWVVDDSVLVDTSISREWAVPFDAWVANHVAELITKTQGGKH